jgi:transposase
MPYSSSLTAEEWEILEPLLPQILPVKKQTRPCDWTKRELLNGIFYQLKNGCNWQDLTQDLPPYSTVYWHYKQWQNAGAIEKLMSLLHSQVREKLKKSQVDNVADHRFPSDEEYLLFTPEV